MSKAVRLQKILADAGVASRRRAEELILQGRVTVNGQVVTAMGTKADPEKDHIKVDGRRIRRKPAGVWILLNKPKGVISSVRDPQGRTTVMDLVRSQGRLFHVGRLDYNSEGLLILTNDGELSKIVGAAGSRIPKVYEVKVRAVPSEESLNRLRDGIRLPDGTRLAGAGIRALRQSNNSWCEVTLTQGRNREIRRMFEAIGHPVLKLRRTRIGFLTDRGLPVGSYRPLARAEVEEFYRLAGVSPSETKK
jgi:pseudouridine synthase